MSNSSLVTCTVKSPNHSGKRTHAVDRITPHCVVGQLSASAIGGCFTSTSRQASCNYGIGTEGGVCLVVDEANRSWCSSSNANDQRAITIEWRKRQDRPLYDEQHRIQQTPRLVRGYLQKNTKKRNSYGLQTRVRETATSLRVTRWC